MFFKLLNSMVHVRFKMVPIKTLIGLKMREILDLLFG